MKVADNCIVSLDYTLHLGDGVVIDSSEGQPLAYLHGHGQIVPGLEKQIAGMDVGESKQVVVPPGEGYGDRDPEHVQTVPKSQFDGEVKAGDEFLAVDDEENEIPARVQSVNGDQVTVDFNHPLAGKSLHFNVTVKGVRQATEEEMQHGHAHGEDGHGHDH